LGLLDDKGELISADISIEFDEYLLKLHPEHKPRVKAYFELKGWITEYESWKTSKTLNHLCRYEARKDKSTPWGKQTYWEDILTLRRGLEAWEIKPDSLIKPFDKELDEEILQNILRIIGDHPLKT
jgi:hypothetical protein